MKVRDLIIQLQALPQGADVELDLGEEYHGFTVVHATPGNGASEAHLVALVPEPDPPHIAEIHAKYDLMAEAAPGMLEALSLTSGALQCVAKMLPFREQEVIHFTGRWERFDSLTLTAILDRANAALEPYGDSDAG